MAEDLKSSELMVLTSTHANAGVGIASTTLKIKNFDDYNANYSSATDFYYAGKNPGTYLSDLKVATIDDFGDQVIGVNTTDLGNLGAATIGFGVTSVLSGILEAGVGTTKTIDGHLKGNYHWCYHRFY